MSRRRRAKKRETMPDPKYQSTLLQMLVNRVMKNGKKTLAYKIVYQIMDNLQKKTNQNPIQVLNQAIMNVKPVVEVKSKRVGGELIKFHMMSKSNEVRF